MRPTRRLAALPLIALAAALAAPAMAQDAEDQEAPGYVEVAPQEVQADTAAFEPALAPYGQWADTAQFGRVWLPAAASDPSWQPYTAGQWLYTDDGWYWKSDEEFGWIVYHYGRWYFDRTYGWLWIPGTEWAPAWVAWRQGEDFVGWTALPPERDAYDVQAVPDLWVFAATSAFVRPNVRVHRFDPSEARVRFGASRFGGRARTRPGLPIGVNPGIDPGLVAGFSDRPLHRYDVRPRLFPNTVGLIGNRPVVERISPQNRPPREIVRRTDDIQPAGPAAQGRPAIAPQRRDVEFGQDGRHDPRQAPGAVAPGFVPPAMRGDPQNQQPHLRPGIEPQAQQAPVPQTHRIQPQEIQPREFQPREFQARPQIQVPPQAPTQAPVQAPVAVPRVQAPQPAPVQAPPPVQAPIQAPPPAQIRPQAAPTAPVQPRITPQNQQHQNGVQIQR